MTNDDSQEPVVVSRMAPGIDGPVTFHHGPVDRKSATQPFEVVRFTGAEESDILHAAGWWARQGAISPRWRTAASH
ncbi:hypothetical protein GCM10010232_18020 [Streptomyces amakusaensis]|uniref:Uncharacterized protein n=1 Tax=Streptomyces amakusaensis TaxID=67271 RepID=A0ABW0AMP2_9ACTN